ncbi:MAG: S-adenosylmethionine:tRNA ribosyltransferase-isomerase [Candidatus Dormibacteraeota bacterium]|nr:S-adenosylmethionine:tRNA ribosyltransferase-isomerase [Candidatus Dormibacteraeota bacterium]
MSTVVAPALDFDLPPELEATEPPEERGRGRDDVRLLVSERSNGRLEHRAFADLPALLRPGDLLVVNRSRTRPAALRGTVDGEPATVHLSARRDDGAWVVELRHSESSSRGTSPWLDAVPATIIRLPDGGTATLLRPAAERVGAGVRLWAAELELPGPTGDYLARWGRPIVYAHTGRPRLLHAYQTVFADEDGSAEMPSAARPFTTELVTRLIVQGVGLTAVLLHCGISSAEAGEPLQAEWFSVPAVTAQRVNATLRLGGRVIAVGTTVVRALESAVAEPGLVLPAEGWTDAVVDLEHPPRVVGAVLTGWHEPRASHLAMLEAIAGPDLLRASYRAALAHGYMWHEFGDSHLVLP